MAKHVDKGIFVVFRYTDDGEVVTNSYTDYWGTRHPAAKMYNTEGTARSQWHRYFKQGIRARGARITFNRNGIPSIRFIDQDWEPTPLSKREWDMDV